MAVVNILVLVKTGERLLDVQILYVLTHLFLLCENYRLGVNFRPVSKYVLLRLGNFAASDFFSYRLLLLPRVYISQESVETAVLLLGGMSIYLWCKGRKIIFKVLLYTLFLNLFF